MTKRMFLLSLLMVFSLTLWAQIKSPQAYFTHAYGDQFTQHHQLVDYVKYLGDNSPMVKVVEYGKTNQGRPLLLAFVSSADNIEQLDDIRLNNLRHAAVADGEVDASLDRALVWLSYGVHGNEAGASESSMQVLYDLVSGNTEDMEMQIDLSKAVVIIDPCINPDGYNRYVQWYLNRAGAKVNIERFSMEHDEPWPGGRVNHYHFDLNRDWAWATQVETQQRLAIYNNWLPHIHGDYHEQYPDNPYYFAPAAEPLHAFITDWQRKFQYEIGKFNAKQFDRMHWLYFTREVFDLFYPSYGDTYPTFNGAIGMTYEQAGHGIAGRAVSTEIGDTLFLQDRIDHHRVTSLATINKAILEREEMIAAFDQYYERAIINPSGKYKTYVLRQSDNGSLRELLKLLDLHGITYGSLGSDRVISGYHYQEMKNKTIEVNSDDIVISAYQPKSVLLQTLFEPAPKIVDSLTYDITAWSLPYAYGIESIALTERLSSEDEGRVSWTPKSTITGKPVAYYLEWRGFEDARSLAKLLGDGIKVRYSTSKIETRRDLITPGSLIITSADNADMDNFHEYMRNFQNETATDLGALTSGFAVNGPDLGSDRIKYIAPPKILLLGGDQTSEYTYGHLWHYLDVELEYAYTTIDVDRLSERIIDDYNVIIMPDGSYRLSEVDLSMLNTWMRRGGRIIAIGSAINAFEGKDGFAVKRFTESGSQDTYAKELEERRLDHRLEYVGDQIRTGVSDWSPGAIVKIHMDPTYWLSYGIGDTYFSLKTSSSAYEHMTGAVNAGYIKDKVEYQGFIGKRAQDRLKNTTTFFVEDKGGGKLICMVDNPLYRGFWFSGKLLFANALFF